MRDRIRAKTIRPLQDFLDRETSSGFLLLAAAALGLAIANSPLGDGYFNLLDRYLIDLNFDFWGLELFLKLTVLKFINYLLMTFFFFVVGLEIFLNPGCLHSSLCVSHEHLFLRLFVPCRPADTHLRRRPCLAPTHLFPVPILGSFCVFVSVGPFPRSGACVRAGR